MSSAQSSSAPLNKTVFNEMFKIKFLTCKSIIDFKSQDAVYVSVGVFVENGFIFSEEAWMRCL